MADEDSVVTMLDVLKEQEDFEESANAVLGASDDKNCTFQLGYVKRQALYACLTCSEDAKFDENKRAGVCLACSLKCHENHELIELYTKRNFRCDCSTKKFPDSHNCMFINVKNDDNTENKYNQNFLGLYCACHRPYPDPENMLDEEMIQCIVCEDWLHANHLESPLPSNENYAEMICKDCMEKNEFLHDYTDIMVNIDSVKTVETSMNKDDMGVNEVDQKHFESGKEIEKQDFISSKENNIGDNFSNLVKDEQNVREQESEEINSDSKFEGPCSEKNDATLDTYIKENDDNKEQPFVQTRDSETNEEGNIFIDKGYIKDQLETAVKSNDDENKMETDDTVKTTDIEVQMEQGSKNPTIESVEQDITCDQDGKTSQLMDETKTKDDKFEKRQEENSDKGQEEDIEKGHEENIENGKEENNEKGKEIFFEKKQEDLEKEHIKSIEKEPIENIEEAQEENIKKGNDEYTEKKQDNFEKEKEENIEKEQEENIEKEQEENIEKEQEENIEKEQEENIEEKQLIKKQSDENQTTILKSVGEIVADEKSMDKMIAIDDTLPKIEISNVQSITNNPDLSNGEPMTEDCSENSKKRKLDDNSDVSSKKVKISKENCTRVRCIAHKYFGATFWPHNWRKKICSCVDCIALYKKKDVLFLLDLDDTVTAYEDLGKEKNGNTASQYERGLEALSQLDRIQQINALTEYNKMKEKLLDFLKSFKDKQEIVKEEDIKEFFAEMKPRREPDGVYFCT